MFKYIVTKDYSDLSADENTYYAYFKISGSLDWVKSKSLATNLNKEDAVDLVKILNHLTDDITFAVEPVENLYNIESLKIEDNVQNLRYVSHVSIQTYTDLDMQVVISWTDVKQDAVKIDKNTGEKYINIIKSVLDINVNLVRTDLDVLT